MEMNEMNEMNALNALNELDGSNAWNASDETNEDGIKVNNAGVIMLNAYFPRLFTVVDYLNDRRLWVNEEQQIRAIFLLQYIVLGKEQEYKESELVFNKLLVGWPLDKTLPAKVELTEKEKETVASLFTGIRQTWTKMKNTSDEGLRQAFFQREGRLVCKPADKQWIVTVQEKAYDMLIDSLPWSFTPVRFPWSDYLIFTKWRN